MFLFVSVFVPFVVRASNHKGTKVTKTDTKKNTNRNRRSGLSSSLLPERGSMIDSAHPQTSKEQGGTGQQTRSGR
jgi:hypothetical protein